MDKCLNLKGKLMMKILILITIILSFIGIEAKAEIEVLFNKDTDISNVVGALMDDDRPKWLHFYDGITIIPDTVFCLSNIVRISYYSDSLCYISDHIFKCAQLRSLEIHDAIIPNEDVFCKRMKELKSLRDLTLKLDNEQIDELFKMDSLEYLTFISKSNSDYIVSKGILKFKNMIRLELANFKSLILPSELETLDSLRYVRLQIKDYNSQNIQVFNPNALEYLSISTSYPGSDSITLDGIPKYSKLKELSISGFRIEASTINELSKIATKTKIIFKGCDFSARSIIALLRSEFDAQIDIQVECPYLISPTIMKSFLKKEKPKVKFYDGASEYY